VHGLNNVGGLVGKNGDSVYYHNGGGTIRNCYATGEVDGDATVGGLVGENFNGMSSGGAGIIGQCYSAGAVLGVSQVGGLVGNNDGGAIEDSFWNVDTTGQGHMCGVQASSGTGCNNNYGKTTGEMQTKSTYADAGWDFVGETVNGTDDIWRMCVDGVSYALLSWEFAEADLLCPHGVDLVDFSHLADHWQESDCGSSNDCNRTDLDFSGAIDWGDLKIFCDHWLDGLLI
jgi:hypothetical protein